MGFKTLNDAGVADIFKNAIIVLKERGHAKGVTIDPSTGKVDALGALYLAAGAKPSRMAGFTCTTPEQSGVAEYYVPKLYAAIDFIENMNEMPIEAWNDLTSTTAKTVEACFRKSENIIRIAVT